MPCKSATNRSRRPRLAQKITLSMYPLCSGSANISKAYKALALLLLDNGKDNEAIALVDRVRKTHPADRKLIAILAQALDLLGKGRLFESRTLLIKVRR